MSCTAPDCEICRPFGMVEWGVIRAWRMRDEDDEGIGGVKQGCPHGGWSPFNWWSAARRSRER